MHRLGKLNVAREFFSTELKSSLERNSVVVDPYALEYLVTLLVRHIESDAFFSKDEKGQWKNPVLVDLYAEYLQGTPEVKRAALQRLGDICLLISGFFSDSLNRKLVDIDYYLGMGGSAYWTLAGLHMSPVDLLYKEMAEKIRPISCAIGEISERAAVQSNTDLLRVYEKWLHTGSDRLRGLLIEHGITTIQTKTRH